MEYKQIEKSWKKKLEKEFKNPYFYALERYIEQERRKKNVFPSRNKVFSAFENLALDDVKVVILGQDPYHKRGLATGEAFAIYSGKNYPPSLRNIYKEIRNDTKGEPGDFSKLKEQGVLLLNTILTVSEGEPLSHANKGWERFTDEVLSILLKNKKKIVFLLWGNKAKKKMEKLFKGEGRHLILKAGHPSPLSAKYFLGCGHFTKANKFLKEEREKIDWNKR